MEEKGIKESSLIRENIMFINRMLKNLAGNKNVDTETICTLIKVKRNQIELLKKYKDEEGCDADGG